MYPEKYKYEKHISQIEHHMDLIQLVPVFGNEAKEIIGE
jgi:hypothetical protein